MTIVIPSWEIMEVLNMPELKKLRDQKTEDEKSDGIQKFTLESAQDLSANPQSNPEHKEDFDNLFNAAVKGNPSEH